MKSLCVSVGVSLVTAFNTACFALNTCLVNDRLAFAFTSIVCLSWVRLPVFQKRISSTVYQNDYFTQILLYTSRCKTMKTIKITKRKKTNNSNILYNVRPLDLLLVLSCVASLSSGDEDVAVVFVVLDFFEFFSRLRPRECRDVDDEDAPAASTLTSTCCWSVARLVF